MKQVQRFAALLAAGGLIVGLGSASVDAQPVRSQGGVVVHFRFAASGGLPGWGRTWMREGSGTLVGPTTRDLSPRGAIRLVHDDVTAGGVRIDLKVRSAQLLSDRAGDALLLRVQIATSDSFCEAGTGGTVDLSESPRFVRLALFCTEPEPGGGQRPHRHRWGPGNSTVAITVAR